MQNGHDDFQGGFPFEFRVIDIVLGVDRDPAPVIKDRDGIVRMDGHIDVLGEAGQDFVDRIVDDFVDEVMHAGRTRGADIHPRPLADGPKPSRTVILLAS